MIDTYQERCERCTAPAYEDKTLCLKHLILANVSALERYHRNNDQRILRLGLKRELKTAQITRYRHKKRSFGQCIQCGQPAKVTVTKRYSRCDYHLQKQRDRYSRRIQKGGHHAHYMSPKEGTLNETMARRSTATQEMVERRTSKTF